ncbi:MAG TPA: glycoside hydrolase family 78 protein [Verrucomicrobiae bacterium]
MPLRHLVAALFLAAGVACQAARLAPDSLRCEYLAGPLGIDETAPRLSWLVHSSRRGEGQTACQILVASSPKLLSRDSGDLWDSGRLEGADTIGIAYQGRPLSSGEFCYWKVRVWDADGKRSSWSKPALWSMGLLRQEDWTGDWIGFDKMRTDKPIPAEFGDAKWIRPVSLGGSGVFMSTLTLPDNVLLDNAELLVAPAEHVSFNINGSQIQLRPAKGGNARIADVTSQLKHGQNTVRVSVNNSSDGPAALIVKLTAKAGGSVFTLVTDSSWRATNNGGANWHNRPISSEEWPAAQVIGPAGSAPWGPLSYTDLFLPPPPYLRKEFTTSRPVSRAMLYVTALGLASVHLNGALVSEDRFTPGWTDYTKRVLCRAYDVTSMMREGKNALGAILADGWYSGFVGYGGRRDYYGKKPRLRAQLQIQYKDGSSETVATGPDWKASDGPVREADFLMGETFDARLASKWDQPGFNDSRWEPVVTGAEMTPLIQAHPGPPVRTFARILPKSVTEPSPGVFVFDMGQNFAGVARLEAWGEPGQVITLRFAERLRPDGNIYTINLRGARATDQYICRGYGLETWEPHLTYHGFQYIEVTGLSKHRSSTTITGIALSSATADAGSFNCSDPMLNRLAKNIYWTQRANFIDIPTDCPQRDERLGWMGDAQVYIRAATLNEDVQSFFAKWLTDVQDGQRADGEFPMVAPVKVAGDDGGPAWADAGVICPWTIYQVYGDTRVLERHYDSMAKFIEFCQHRSRSNLLPPARFHCFGDWLNIGQETPHTVICEAYFAYCTHLMAEIARALGRNDDAVKYNDLFERVKAAFNRAYVSEDGRIEGDTQTDYVLALSFGLLDEANQKRAAQYLVENIQKRDWHLATGFIGTKSLMLTLARIGRNDVASRLIHNDTFPSWGFSIKQGATSIWERWDGWTPDKGFEDPGMNSFAHYSFGAVYQWMVENLGGIQSDGPDYKHIVIAPQPDGRLTFADTAYDSIRGRIETHWAVKGDSLRLKVTIPANTDAIVKIPNAAGREVYENGHPATRSKGVAYAGMEGAAAVYKVVPGQYDFVAK